MMFIAHVDRLREPLSAAARGVLTVEAAYAVRDAASAHGLVPWLAHAALRADGGGSPHARDWLADRVREATAVEAARRAETRRAIDRLASARVPSLVLKGAHLAHALYSAPHLRPHSDLDLLIPEAQRDIVRESLVDAGYALVPHVRGDLILAQMHLLRRNPSGVRHAIDLHWRALNPHAFRHLLPFGEAHGRSQSIPPLGENARGLSDTDALLLACAHLAAHHGAALRLIWLLDVHLLALRFGHQDWATFVALARREGVAAVAMVVLDATASIFATPVSDEARRGLLARGSDERLTAAYLRQRSRAGTLWLDLRAIGTWRERARCVTQHLLPDRDYMRDRYGASGAGVLWAYVRRAAGGAAEWLRRPAQGGRFADRAGAAARPSARSVTSPSGAATGPGAWG